MFYITTIMCEGIDAHYPLTPNKKRVKDNRGIGLVIVNSFKDFPDLYREGAKKELQMLTKLFASFNLEVRSHIELTKNEIVKVLEETAKDPKLIYDSMIAIAISSHGCEEGLLGINQGERLRHRNDPNYKNMDDCIPPTQIQEIFNGENCPSLAGKPKLLLLNGCRGKGIENIVQIEGEDEKERFVCDTITQLATTWSDFFVIHSCVIGKLSLRSNTRGSLFLIEFFEAYAKYGSKYPIESIMPTVNRNLIIMCQRKDTPSKQSCTWESTCTRSLLISPVDAELHLIPPIKQVTDNFGPFNQSLHIKASSIPKPSYSEQAFSKKLHSAQQDLRNPTPYSGKQTFIGPTSYPSQQDFHKPTSYPRQQDFHKPTSYLSQQDFHKPTSYPSQQDFHNPTSYPSQQDFHKPTSYPSQQDFHKPTSSLVNRISTIHLRTLVNRIFTNQLPTLGNRISTIHLRIVEILVAWYLH